MTDPVMTIREVALALKLAEKTVYLMASEGELPAFKIRGQWRVRRSDFESWLHRQSGGREESRPADATRVNDAERDAGDDERPVGDLTERVPPEEMHQKVVEALGSTLVRSHGSFASKPFELDLAPPLPQRVRIYMYNATRPPGGRPLGEHKIQLIVPGQRRAERASFDNGDGRIVLLIGYAAEEDVFVLWDAGLYSDFAWSRNVQVKAETIIEASAGKLATQERQLRPPTGRPTVETLIAVKPRRLAEAIARRMELTRERLLRE